MLLQMIGVFMKRKIKCNHAYVQKEHHYYDKFYNCRVRVVQNICIKCGHKEKEMKFYERDPKRDRDLPFFGDCLK